MYLDGPDRCRIVREVAQTVLSGSRGHDATDLAVVAEICAGVRWERPRLVCNEGYNARRARRCQSAVPAVSRKRFASGCRALDLVPVGSVTAMC